MAYYHAAFEQQLLNVAQAQLKAEMPTHRATDDCSRKAVTVIEGFRFHHRAILREHLGNVTAPIQSIGLLLGDETFDHIVPDSREASRQFLYVAKR
ncbi:hypothetical protein B0G81_7972 [Paraburkholderia sp. BL6665CI2N2]|nr:hypothetical protein B0G81_7972 [Paraburkholderia sp. BL6665CI2N2]